MEDDDAPATAGEDAAEPDERGASSAIASSGGPYKGLAPYAPGDAPFFFGRDEWRDIVIDNLRAYRLTLMYGDSGAGKTSLLRAGVLDELRRRAARNLAARGTPGLAAVVFREWSGDPLRALVDALHQSVAGGPELVGILDLAGTIEHVAARAAGRVFIVLDQFEEYFLYRPDAGADGGFADALAEAINRRELRVSFLISMREDAVAKLDRFKARIPTLFDNYLRVEPLDRAAAREAIVRPVEEYNRRTGESMVVPPALVDAVLDEVEAGKVVVGAAGAGTVDGGARGRTRIETPYLQLVMTRLWEEERRAGSPTLRAETFKALGGAQGIVRTHLDAAMRSLPPDQQDIAAELFNHLVTPSGSKIAQDVDDLARYVDRPREETFPVLNTLAGEIRILRPVGSSSYEIYHDALAGPILDWRLRRRERQRRAREARRIRIFGGVALACAVVAAGLVILTVVALQAKDEADEQRARAREQERLVKLGVSKELAGSAASHLGDGSGRALRLALRAHSVARTPEAAGVLRAAVSQPLLRIVLGDPRARVQGVAFSPGGDVVATTDAVGRTRVWRASNGARVATLEGRTSAVGNAVWTLRQPLQFSRVGDLAAAAGRDGVTRVWRTSTWKRAAALEGRAGPVVSARFSADGDRLITVGRDGTVDAWDTATWRRTVVDAGRGAVHATLSPDGRHAAVLLRDSRLRLVPLGRRGRIATLGAAAAPLRDRNLFIPHLGVEFSRDGRYAAATTPDGRARVWDVVRRRLTTRVRRPGAGVVNATAIAPDGALFVAVGDDGRAQLRSTRTGRVVGDLRRGGEELVSAAFSPDGALYAVGGSAGTVLVRDAGTGGPVARLRIPGGGITWSMSFSPDGESIVAATEGRGARVWDLSGRRPVRAIPRRLAGAWSVAFSPGGALLALSQPRALEIASVREGRTVAIVRGRLAGFSRDGSRLAAVSGRGVTVWDTASWRRFATVADGGSPIMDARLSPDGRWVATLDRDGSARLWRVAATPVPPRVLGTGGDRALRPGAGELAFSSDGALLMVAAGTTSTWRVPSGRRLARVGGAANVSSAVALSPDGRRIVSADASGVAVWDPATGTRQRRLSHAEAWSPRVSDDGSVIAATVAERLTTWDAATGRRIGASSRGGRSPVTLSPNGECVLAAAFGSLHLQVARGGHEIMEWSGNRLSAAFDPDGRRIAVAANGPTRIYAADACGRIEDVAALARQRLDRARGGG